MFVRLLQYCRICCCLQIILLGLLLHAYSCRDVSEARERKSEVEATKMSHTLLKHHRPI